MKEILRSVAGFLVGAVAVAALVYLRWKALQGRVKDLGDGGIQTLWGSRRAK